MNIIFMGTPDFGVPALRAIINSKDHKVTAVFSQQPKPKGRGMKVHASPIHTLALAHNIPVYTPTSLKTEEALALINSISADIIVVVAYGFIIPQNILESKKYGCLNIHPSKLPKYRGAAPLQWTIINGDKESAVCIIQMDAGLDTGDIILQRDFPVLQGTTFMELHERCANIGAELIIQALDNIETLPKIKQSEESVVYAPKLTKEDGRINWQDSAFKIDCMVRGMNPWPGAYFKYDNTDIKIIGSEFIDRDHEFIPGTIISKRFEVACGKGILRLIKIQPENKPKMSGEDYLRGIQGRISEQFQRNQ